MPYSPPCSDDYHASIICPYFWIEDGRIEKEYQSKAGILYTSLNGKRASVFIVRPAYGAHAISYSKRQEIVCQYNKENISYACHE